MGGGLNISEMKYLELKFRCLKGHDFTKTVQKENCTIMDDGYVHIQETCPSCGERQEFLGSLEQFAERLEGRMDITELVKKASDRDLSDPSALNDLFELCRLLEQENFTEAHQRNKEIRRLSGKYAVEQGSARMLEINKRALLFDAPHDFDAYLRYVESDRPLEKMFYMPRRHVLKVLVDDLQDLADGDLDFLGISLPPRVGKSTLCIFFMTWIMGRNPDAASVMSGHSDKLTDGFYRELLSILNDKETYLWADVFPGVKVVDTSAKNETIDLVKKKRFPTMTCRSIGGTLTGAVEIGTGGVLYCDDLIEDLEESLNPDRLQAKYDAYLNQLKDRKKMGALELMVGTRWNVFDCMGRIQEQYADNERYRFRVIPALNENNESNFNYKYNLGFDTAYYLDMKDSIDDATWNAKYQGNPYIREGLLFPEDELLTYNGVLPDGEPERLAVCDVAWGGGDSLAMPIAYKYADRVYIHDVIFNQGDKTVTYPVVIGRIKQHALHRARFEANNGGSEYCDYVDEQLRKSGYRVNLTSRKAPNNQSKLARIIQFAPDIKKFYFLDDKHRSKEYRAFMREVTTFVQTGKNPHDDAADSLSQLADELYHGGTKVEVFQRPF